MKTFFDGFEKVAIGIATQHRLLSGRVRQAAKARNWTSEQMQSVLNKLTTDYDRLAKVKRGLEQAGETRQLKSFKYMARKQALNLSDAIKRSKSPLSYIKKVGQADILGGPTAAGRKRVARPVQKRSAGAVFGQQVEEAKKAEKPLPGQ